MIEQETHREREPGQEVLRQRLAEIAERGEKLGVRVGLTCIDADRHIIDHRADEPFVQASLYKMGVAKAIIEHIEDGKGSSSEPVPFSEHLLSNEGGDGRYDQGEAWRDGDITVSDLVQDMITKSGNTSAKHLVDWVGGPDAVNHVLQAGGYVGTYLEPLEPQRSKYYCGATTPEESLRLMAELCTYDKPLIPPLYDSFLQSDHQAGVRRYIFEDAKSGDAIEVAAKYGSLQGYDLGDVAQTLFHEVALISNRETALLLAVCTDVAEQGSKLAVKAKQWVAREIVGQSGAVVAEHLGNTTRPNGLLGGTALRAFARLRR